MKNNALLFVLFLYVFRCSAAQDDPVVILSGNLYFGGKNEVWDKNYTCEALHGIPCMYSYDATLSPRADALLFHLWEFDKTGAPTHPSSAMVGISMEGPALAQTMADPEAMAKLNLMSSYQIHADAPTFYEEHGRLEMHYTLLKSPQQKKEDGRPIVVWIASNCLRVFNHRNEYIKELMTYINIDAYGECMNNKPKISRDIWTPEITQNYKFTLAFENSNCEDYVTEKIHNAQMAGSVPIYMGTRNVANFVPFNHSYIDVNDFSTIKDLADYLLKLDADDDLYNSYLWYKKYKSSDDVYTPEWKQTTKYTSRTRECGLCSSILDDRYVRQKEGKSEESGKEIVNEKEYYHKYVRADETCESFPQEIRVLEDAEVKHNLNFETENLLIPYKGTGGIIIDPASDTNVSHHLLLSISTEEFAASYTFLELDQTVPTALMISARAMTNNDNTFLYFSILFRDGTLIPDQKLNFSNPNWEYACAVLPTYKPIASVFVAPALEATLTKKGKAAFDDIQITTFREGLVSRRYLNPFPRECKLIKSVPTSAPLVDVFFLHARTATTSTDARRITMCTHLPFSQLKYLDAIVDKWRGLASVVVWVSSHEEAEAVARWWYDNPILSFYADIHLVHASKSYSSYPTHYFRKLAISAARTDMVFYLPNNYITPSGMHNSLLFALDMIEKDPTSVFVVPVFASLTPHILTLKNFYTYVPESKQNLENVIVNQEHYNSVSYLANRVISYKKWLRSSEQFFYESTLSTGSHDNYVFYLAHKSKLLNGSFRNRTRYYVFSQLFAIQIATAPAQLSPIGYMSWEIIPEQISSQKETMTSKRICAPNEKNQSFRPGPMLPTYLFSFSPIILLAVMFFGFRKFWKRRSK